MTFLQVDRCSNEPFSTYCVYCVYCVFYKFILHILRILQIVILEYCVFYKLTSATIAYIAYIALRILRNMILFYNKPFGKSLTFQILPPLCKCLKSMGHNFLSNPLVVIVSPLLSIMEDQVKWLRSQGFSAAYIGESNSTDRNFIDGQEKFNFAYGSPESLTGDSRFRNMFS